MNHQVFLRDDMSVKLPDLVRSRISKQAMKHQVFSKEEVSVELPRVRVPCVFRGAVRDWSPASIDLDGWNDVIGGRPVTFRVGRRPEYVSRPTESSDLLVPPLPRTRA
jgi:hypothetical protein